MLEVAGVKLVSSLLGPVADCSLDRRGQDSLAIAVEEPVVAVGHHGVTGEEDHAAPLFEESVERGNLGLGKLGDVAKDHGIERREVA